MRPAEIEKIIKAGGWRLDRQRGSHRVYIHPIKPGIVIIAWHNKDIPAGTLSNIMKQAGL